MPSAVIPAIILVALIVGVGIIFGAVPPALLITARAAGLDDVTPVTLIGMWLRRVPQERIVIPLIAAAKAGIPLSLTELEDLYRAGGSVDRVVNALIMTKNRNIPFTYEQARQMTLSGQDPQDYVRNQAETTGSSGGAL